MQSLKSVRGTIVRTTILDKYLNVQINPAPFCTQGKRQFYTVSAVIGKQPESSYILKIAEHSTDAEEFNAEIEALLEGWNLNPNLTITCPYIAKILGVRICKEPGTGRVYSETLLEDCGENLLDYVNKHEVSIAELSEIADQVVQALVHAQSQGVYHGDLRPEKIFVKGKIAKVIDFGGALFIGVENDANTKKLLSSWNTAYWPPEKFSLLDAGLSKADKIKMLESFDVYSWGMSFYQILSKKSLKDIEKENIIHKQSSETYKGFMKLISDLAIQNKQNSIYKTYFEPLLPMTLEFNNSKRATILSIRDHSYHNKGIISKNEAKEKSKNREMQAAIQKLDEKNAETNRGTCHACMKDKNAILKATMECGHKVCENCAKELIKKMTTEPTKGIFQFHCFICKEKKIVKEIYLKCKCNGDIERIKQENKSKIISFSKDRIVTAYCLKGHELSEEETFMIFGTLKLVMANEKITKDTVIPLANALEKMHLIEHIDLRQNQIEFVGLESLTGVLGTKTTLSELHLDWNPLGPDGGRALRGLFETSSSLKILTIGIFMGKIKKRYVSVGI